MSTQSRLNKFAKSGSVKVTTFIEWDYELANPIDGVVWVPEDDERSASWKAKGDHGSGFVRSREVTVTTTTTPKGVATPAIAYSDWDVKTQNLV